MEVFNVQILPAIEAAWNDVAQAQRNEYLVTQSMLAFVFCRALRQKLPSVKITYDGRVFTDQEANFNLLIWQDRAAPVVYFIGYLKYGLDHQPAPETLILMLKEAANKSEAPLLTHDPDSRGYEEKQIRVSSDCEFGLFFVDKLEEHMVDEKFVSNVLSTDELTRFHLGLGPIEENGPPYTSFQYLNPSCFH